MSLLLSLCLLSENARACHPIKKVFSHSSRTFFPHSKGVVVKVCRKPVNQKFIIRVAIRIRTMLMPQNLQYYNPFFEYANANKLMYTLFEQSQNLTGILESGITDY
jgi:hypothetical protein